jgi:phosphatidylserine decarboxylase
MKATVRRRRRLLPIVKEGLLYLGGGALAALLAALMGWPLVATGLGALTLFMAYFFRDPERLIPEDPLAILSPADGRVVLIRRPEWEAALGERSIQVSIFLSLFNVHVNRAPCGGRVLSTDYRPGRFLAAFKSEASALNEQNIIQIGRGDLRVTVRQVAGFLARRIVCWAEPGDEVAPGERLGLIRFGSRVDLILPEGVRLCVAEGDRVKGGRDIVAWIL